MAWYGTGVSCSPGIALALRMRAVDSTVSVAYRVVDVMQLLFLFFLGGGGGGGGAF